MDAETIRKELKKQANPKKAKELQRFFKTGPGEYGEGDIFLGIKVPDLRKLAKNYQGISLSEIKKLIQSKVHDERFVALILLLQEYKKTEKPTHIYDFYLEQTAYINNWDLVDVSAHHIVGHYLFERSRKPLYKLARSKDLWERRISIISTFHFIRNHDFEDTLKISKILLKDPEDLIHKAVGWMLRETGNKDRIAEERFLKDHYQEMPRTMLRYAIEKFPEKKRQDYLKGRI